MSVDVPWSPYDVDGRSYDWLGLAEAADLLFVMAYDIQSQVGGMQHVITLVLLYIGRTLDASLMRAAGDWCSTI